MYLADFIVRINIEKNISQSNNISPFIKVVEKKFQKNYYDCYVFC